MHPLSLEIATSPAYELLLALAAIGAPAEYAGFGGDEDRLAALRSLASAELLDDLHRLTGGCDLVLPHAVALVHGAPEHRSVADVAGYLASLEPLDVYLHLLGYHVRYFRRATPPETIRAAAEGDEAARERFLETSYPEDAGWQAGLQALLAVSPEEARDLLIAVLRRGYEETFRQDEPETMRVLERGAEAKRALLWDLSPADLIDVATNGIEYVPEPGIERVLLIPSLIIRPQIHTMDCGSLKIFCYPVAGESITAAPDAPPERLLRLATALGDARRLEVLKLLSRERRTLGEIADHFGVAKTTMHHHLVILRSAGLIRQRTADRTYALRREVIPTIAALLDAYLQGGE